MDTYRAGPHKFEFDWHYSGHSGPRYFAINVKFCTWPRLPEEYEERLARMVRAGHVKENELNDRGWEDTQQHWWDWAQELANDDDLGKVYSAGRCGGWLILHDMESSKIDTCCEEYEAECVNCGASYATHVKEKCLFDSTMFESANPEPLKTLEKLNQFQGEIRASKDWANETYLEYLMEWVDIEWREYHLERRRMRDEKRDRRTAVLVGSGDSAHAAEG